MTLRRQIKNSLLPLLLIFFAQKVCAQLAPADDFFNSGAQLYISNNIPAALDQPVKIPGDVEWIVVKRAVWTEACNVPLETWAAQHHAKITLSVSIVTLVSAGEQTWCVLHIEKP